VTCNLSFGFRHISEIHVTTFVSGDHPGCKFLPENTQFGASVDAPTDCVICNRSSARTVSKQGRYSRCFEKRMDR